MMEPSAKPRSTSWAWIAAIWGLGAVFDAAQSIFIMHAASGAHWFLPFVIYSLTWLPWALATPFIIKLARRWPIARGVILKGAGAHLLTLISMCVLAETWSSLLLVGFNPWHRNPPPQFASTWTVLFFDQIIVFGVAYSLILTITYVTDSRANMARQLTETARLNEELSRAQLDALRRQMDPHFMFNTLNAIAGLVRERKNEAAVGMIVALSDFLRRVASSSGDPQARLGEEVEFLEKYLQIQEARFAGRLNLQLEIPESLRAALVPSLTLQPLVENAVKHGIAKRAQGGRVRVSASRTEQAMLCLKVYNDGPLLDDDGGPRQGIGLSNLRTRLGLLHGKNFDLRLQNHGITGVEVTVILPYREA